MASRLPIVVGILAIAGGITWFAVRRTSDPAATTGGSGTLTVGSGSGSGKAAIFAPEGPALAAGSDSGSGGGSSDANAFDTPRPALPDGGVVPSEKPSHRDVFAAQTRDNDWAEATEEDLKDRLRTLKVTTVSSVDCRTDQCELTLGGPAADVEASMAKLETGLVKTATSLLLGRPERSDDKLTIRVYAIYTR